MQASPAPLLADESHLLTKVYQSNRTSKWIFVSRSVYQIADIGSPSDRPVAGPRGPTSNPGWMRGRSAITGDRPDRLVRSTQGRPIPEDCHPGRPDARTAVRTTVQPTGPPPRGHRAPRRGGSPPERWRDATGSEAAPQRSD